MLYPVTGKKLTASDIQPSLDQLHRIIMQRLGSYFAKGDFDLDDWAEETFGADFITAPIKSKLPQVKSINEWIILMLALVPHISPSFISNIMSEQLPSGGEFPEFGGVKGVNHRGILPTGETARFIIAGDDVEKGLDVLKYFEENHFFYQQDILFLEPVREGEPFLSGRIVLAPEWVNRLITDKEVKPRFSPDFPARLTTTKMSWEDLVLHPHTAEQVDDLKRWMSFHKVVEEDDNLSRKINPGYRVLFYGPSGTGKTLTATLLGKEFKKDVYRIDLSQIVSKYIGETEKNLNKIFDRAQHQDWLLFFDEADALFGKRTNVQSSHDKFANQEVSFLLQRIEDFPGIMILASNFKTNIDEAFLRRFHSIVHFPMPNSLERLKLWKQSLPSSLSFTDYTRLMEIAENFEITGASIINVVQYASLKAVSIGSKTLSYDDLVMGIKREMRKDEKS
jgi:adenylate kinase family enzyme